MGLKNRERWNTLLNNTLLPHPPNNSHVNQTVILTHNKRHECNVKKQQEDNKYDFVYPIATLGQLPRGMA